MPDYYEILQVHPRADQETIRAAYERLRQRYDAATLADMPPAEREQAQRHCAELEQAYAVLGDSSRRAAYDAERQPAPEAVIDYRPLPPAQRQERPRDFDPQPMVTVPPVESAMPPTQPKRILPGVVGITATATFLVLMVSLVLTQMDSFSASSNENDAASMLPTPQATATEEEIINQFEGQIVSARQVANQLPDNASAWIELGNLLYDSAQVVRERMPDSDIYQDRLPRWLEASAAYSQALQLEPDNAVVRADRAFSLCIYGTETSDQQFVELGLEEAHKAAQKDPQNSRVLLHLGVCLVSSDPPQTQAALAQWQAILELPISERGVAAEARRLLDIYSQ